MSYFIATIISEKNKLDCFFEILQNSNKKLKKIEDSEFRSNSFDFENHYHDSVIEQELIIESSDDESELDKKKSRKRNRKKKKHSKMDKDEIEEKKKLFKYYKFLTKDLEFLEYQSKTKKKIQHALLQN